MLCIPNTYFLLTNFFLPSWHFLRIRTLTLSPHPHSNLPHYLTQGQIPSITPLTLLITTFSPFLHFQFTQLKTFNSFIPYPLILKIANNYKFLFNFPSLMKSVSNMNTFQSTWKLYIIYSLKQVFRYSDRWKISIMCSGIGISSLKSNDMIGWSMEGIQS